MNNNTGYEQMLHLLLDIRLSKQMLNEITIYLKVKIYRFLILIFPYNF